MLLKNFHFDILNCLSGSLVSKLLIAAWSCLLKNNIFFSTRKCSDRKLGSFVLDLNKQKKIWDLSL